MICKETLICKIRIPLILVPLHHYFMTLQKGLFTWTGLGDLPSSQHYFGLICYCTSMHFLPLNPTHQLSSFWYPERWHSTFQAFHCQVPQCPNVFLILSLYLADGHSTRYWSCLAFHLQTWLFGPDVTIVSEVVLSSCQRYFWQSTATKNHLVFSSVKQQSRQDAVKHKQSR